MDKQLEAKIAKLPKWAQEHIEKITRERETAISALNEWTDSQTESPFCIEDFLCTGEEKGPSFKKRYIQTHNISVTWAGVCLEIRLREDEIDLSWCGGTRHSTSDAAFIPYSYQQARIKSRENMRT
jgi:hypothetical protein